MAEPVGPIAHRTVTAAAVASFGELTGDYSRIHFDHELGRSTPAGRGFAHGLLGASWALGALTRHAPERLGRGDPRAWPSTFEVRFAEVVHFDDTLAFAWEPDATVPGRTSFRCVSHDGRTPTTGAVTIGVAGDGERRFEAGARPASAPPPTSATEPPGASEAWTGEDVLTRGPRGTLPVRTLTESDVLAWARFSGELNPLYLDRPFAESSVMGGLIAPPMLCFCLGFGVWLGELLALPLAGDERSAGHLGDRWRLVEPVRIGDTLALHHEPLSLRRTSSRPDRGVLTFGLRLVAQHGRSVLEGEVDMMLPMCPPERAGDPESSAARA